MTIGPSADRFMSFVQRSKRSGVEQPVARLSHTQEVAGSSPASAI